MQKFIMISNLKEAYKCGVNTGFKNINDVI